MADPTALKPTGRRVRGYISDLVELSGPRSLWTAVVYHEDYRSDPALEAGLDRARAFVAIPMVPGIPGLAHRSPGTYLYDTGEVRTARELIGAAPSGVGWRAAMEMLVRAARALDGARAPEAVASGSLPSHGSLDPHRICVAYDGSVSLLGYGLPRLDVLDFLDDPTLIPPTEAVRFTAPESLEGAAEDFTTDLFVLALVAVELATGTPVYGDKDPRALLAAVADGNARALLRARPLPEGLEAALGPLLEPWPDERPPTPATPVDTLGALIPDLPGRTLGETMEHLAETASDVEVDLPPGWTLPVVAAPVEPAAQKALEDARSRAAKGASVASAAASEASGAASARPGKAVDADPSVQQALAEVTHLVEAASAAAREAEEAAASAAATPDVSRADAHAREAEDAAERARGAAAEAVRAVKAVDRAADAVEARAAADAERDAAQEALRARVAALAKTLEALGHQVEQADALAPPAGDGLPEASALRDAIARVRALRDEATTAHAALGTALAEDGVREAERTVRGAHKSAAQALTAARKAQGELERARAAADARTQALSAAEAALADLTRRAADAATAARKALEGLDGLEHIGTPEVSDARRTAERAASDADDAAEILARIELEPGDDPDAVLDAARTHLQSATNASERAIAAAAEATDADRAVREALAEEAEQRRGAASRHREALAATGVRVERVVAAAEQALADAETSSDGLVDHPAVAEALEALRGHVGALSARRANWRAMAEPAPDIEDPDELEGLVHTGLAEAGFAETDAIDLPPLQAAFTAALESAREERAAAARAREQALADGKEALADAEKEATRVAGLAAKDPLAADAPPEAHEDEALARAAQEFADAVARSGDAAESARAAWARLEREGDDPSDLLAARDAGRQAARDAADAHRILADGVTAIRKRLQAEAEARRTALEAARKARERIDGALAGARVERVPPADEAVAERVGPALERLAQALEAVPADVVVDIDEDPLGAREVLVPLAKQAVAASREVESAVKAYDAALDAAITLVDALRRANERAGAAADRAASAAAATRALRADAPATEDADAVQILAELADLATVADEAAARATEASEAASDAERPEDAAARAEVAEAAATVADEALEEARSRAGALGTVLEAERARQAEADREARERAVAGARRRFTSIAGERARLDDAIQRAATALTERPSTAARAAWDVAEAAVDEATRSFERADAHLRALEASVGAADAASRARALTAEIEAIPERVARAVELAEAAAEAAERDAAENASLVAGIEGLAAAARERAPQLAESLALAETIAAEGVEAADETVGRMREQQAHLAEALAEIDGALSDAPDAQDVATREGLLRAARSAGDRAAAAVNTAVALAKRAEQARAAHLQKQEARRKKAADAASRVARSVARRVTSAADSARDALDRHHGLEDLDAERARIAEALERLLEAGRGLDEHAARAGATEDAAQAEDALEAAQGLAVQLEDRVKATQDAVDAADRARTAADAARAEALARARAEHAALVEQAEAALARASSLVDTATGRVQQARAALTASGARSATTAWEDAERATTEARQALERAQQARAELPDELEAARAAVEEILTEAAAVTAHTATVEPSLAEGLQSAQALAGILEEATQVRARQAALRDRLTDARTRLDLAVRPAEALKTLAERDRAHAQLEELELSMAEADTSLRELGEATSEDEAHALLEVASASIDIAASVFELAMPVVESAIAVADAETAARRARAEALEAATARFRAASDTPPSGPARADLLAVRGDAASLPDDPRLTEALGGLESLEQALDAAEREHRSVIAVALPDDPEPATAMAASAEAGHERVQAALTALQVGVTAARGIAEDVRAVEDARLERVAAARARHAEAVEALGALLEDVAQQLEQGRTAAAPWPDACASALQALEEAVTALGAVDLGAPPEQDDEDAVSAVTDRAIGALGQAREVQIDVLLAEVMERARVAEDAARSRAEQLERARSAIQADLAALVAHLASVDGALSQGRALAGDPPAPDVAAVLAELDGRRAALGDPEPPDDGGDPARAVEIGLELGAALERARELQPDGILEAVQGAVAEAEAEAERRRLEAEAARHRLGAAREALASRKAAGAGLGEELRHAAELPEAESAWNELRDALDQLEALEIPDDDGSDPVAAADAAERIVATALHEDRLAEATRDAVRDARDAREAARARIDAAHDMLTARLASLDAALARDDLPDTPPVAAAHMAISLAADRLREVDLPVSPPEGTPTGALRRAADEVEGAVARILDRDLGGLVRELDRAVREAHAAAAADEAARAETQSAAIATADAAVAEIESAIAAGESAIEEAPRPASARATARSHRSAARDALERARDAVREIRTQRARLDGTVRSEIAIAVAFDIESSADAAREALAEHGTRLRALEDELRRLDVAHRTGDAQAEVLAELDASVAGTLEDAPDPTGSEAEQAYEAMYAAARTLRAATREARDLASSVADIPSAREAEVLVERIRQLGAEAREALETARLQAARVRDASERHLERQAAERAESVAVARERILLAAERAGRAVEDVTRALEQASQDASGHTNDDVVGDCLTTIARANDRALQAADAARAEEPDPSLGDRGVELASERARALADDAEQAARDAKGALDAIRARIEELAQARQAAAAEADAHRIRRRDDAVPRIRSELDTLERELSRHSAEAGDTHRDTAVEVAREKLVAAAARALEAVEHGREALALLARGKPEDVDDFLKDAEQGVAESRQGVLAVRGAASALAAERETARARSAELELEEHRGRAWEACKALRAISSELTRARTALGEIPEHPSPTLRGALDRLAEVERRLWRAGQRADEARERAGSTAVLDDAAEAAVLAEKALGSPGRWEREIDAALQGVTQALRDEPADSPESERIRQLRRGREGQPEGDPHERLRKLRDVDAEATDLEMDSPTEALLERLRRGKSSGETGRDRLRRLREQRRDEEPLRSRAPRPDDGARIESLDPKTLEPLPLPRRGAEPPPEDAATASPGEQADYGGLEDYEDLKPTRVDAPAAAPSRADARRAELMARLRSRSKAPKEDPGASRAVPRPERRRTYSPPGGREMPEEEGRTQFFDASKLAHGDDDAATQMFTREMLDEYVGEAVDDGEE